MQYLAEHNPRVGCEVVTNSPNGMGEKGFRVHRATSCEDNESGGTEPRWRTWFRMVLDIFRLLAKPILLVPSTARVLVGFNFLLIWPLSKMALGRPGNINDLEPKKTNRNSSGVFFIEKPCALRKSYKWGFSIRRPERIDFLHVELAPYDPHD